MSKKQAAVKYSPTDDFKNRQILQFWGFKLLHRQNLSDIKSFFLGNKCSNKHIRHEVDSERQPLGFYCFTNSLSATLYFLTFLRTHGKIYFLKYKWHEEDLDDLMASEVAKTKITFEHTEKSAADDTQEDEAINRSDFLLLPSSRLQKYLK